MFYWFNRTQRGYWVLKSEDSLDQYPDIVGEATVGLGYSEEVWEKFLEEHKDTVVLRTDDNPACVGWELDRDLENLTDEQAEEQFGPKPEEFINYKLHNVKLLEDGSS